MIVCLSDLNTLDEWVACSFPCLHTAGEAFNMLEPQGDELCRLTGGSPFIGSASVEYDLLIFCEGGKLRLKLIK
jgi:hypothetical protein